MGKQCKYWQTLFSWAPKSLWMMTSATKLKDACFLEGKLWETLDSVYKGRDITLLTQVHLIKAIFFPGVMYGWKSCIIKKAEHQRIDAFELWCWRRLLRVPWTARRSNQSILKEINPAYSLEGLKLKMKFQYSGHLMWRTDSLGKTLMLGKIEGKKRRGQQWMRWLGYITNSMEMSLSKLWDMVKDMESWHAAVHGVTKTWTRLGLNNKKCNDTKYIDGEAHKRGSISYSKKSSIKDISRKVLFDQWRFAAIFRQNIGRIIFIICQGLKKGTNLWWLAEFEYSGH